MLRVQVFCFVLFLFCIAVRFGECNSDCNITPHIIDKTRLHWFEEMMKGISGKNIFEMDEIKSLESEIADIDFGDFLGKYPKFRAIYPGTLWCGDGDKAEDAEDLGRWSDTDACCRAHDQCQDGIPAGETKLNLKNNGLYTRSSHACDSEFYQCLKKANSWVSGQVGFTYFNVLRPQSFQCVCNCRPGDVCVEGCSKFKWVDNPKYKKLF